MDPEYIYIYIRYMPVAILAQAIWLELTRQPALAGIDGIVVWAVTTLTPPKQCTVILRN